jgi:hypothetical protein
MPFNFFAPKPGRFGTHPVIFNSGRVNTGTLAAGTATHNIGAYGTKSFISKATVCAETFPSAGACTIRLVKMTGATALNLTDNIDINGKTADTPIQMPILATLSEQERTLNTGDSLRLTMVTTSTVSTQPDDVTVNVELLVEE